eukprot:3750356-Ditylum_brightwellii.AAC.1
MEEQKRHKFQKSQGYYLAKKCRLTLLTHAVGYHKDTFRKNSGDKIEKNVLLVTKDRSNTNSTMALGRGGTGP